MYKPKMTIKIKRSKYFLIQFAKKMWANKSKKN